MIILHTVVDGYIANNNISHFLIKVAFRENITTFTLLPAVQHILGPESPETLHSSQILLFSF